MSVLIFQAWCLRLCLLCIVSQCAKVPSWHGPDVFFEGSLPSNRDSHGFESCDDGRIYVFGGEAKPDGDKGEMPTFFNLPRDNHLLWRILVERSTRTELAVAMVDANRDFKGKCRCAGSAYAAYYREDISRIHTQIRSENPTKHFQRNFLCSHRVVTAGSSFTNIALLRQSLRTTSMFTIRLS
jgi:hypothetical protein